MFIMLTWDGQPQISLQSRIWEANTKVWLALHWAFWNASNLYLRLSVVWAHHRVNPSSSPGWNSSSIQHRQQALCNFRASCLWVVAHMIIRYFKSTMKKRSAFGFQLLIITEFTQTSRNVLETREIYSRLTVKVVCFLRLPQKCSARRANCPKPSYLKNKKTFEIS